MQPSELKSHITLLRLQEQEKLALQTAKALSGTIKVHNIIGSNKHNKKEELKRTFSQLKNDIDIVKARTRKIKSLVDTDNILEEMNRSFYILKDNLKDIFNGQLKLKE
jgi:hypothetical protein